MNKNTATAILIANLKGLKKKRLPLTKIAEAVRVLVRDEEYGSHKKVAKEFKVSRQIIEAFDKINDHPDEIKKLIEGNKILLDASTKLATIPNIQKRIELAKIVAGTTAFDTRYIIDYWKKHPELSAEESKQKALDSKSINSVLHAVIVPLEDELFSKFRDSATKKNLKLEEAAKLAIQEWVTQREG
jgi:hypothetical protein